MTKLRNFLLFIFLGESTICYPAPKSKKKRNKNDEKNIQSKKTKTENDSYPSKTKSSYPQGSHFPFPVPVHCRISRNFVSLCGHYPGSRGANLRIHNWRPWPQEVPNDGTATATKAAIAVKSQKSPEKHTEKIKRGKPGLNNVVREI